MSELEKLRIAIIGGGIVGLALAVGLLKHDHLDVAVYEATSSFSEIGAGLTVGPNARKALESLSPELYRIFMRLKTPNLWQGREDWYTKHVMGFGEQAGQFISAPISPGGHQSVHRALFLDEMAKLVPPGVAQFNKRLVHIEESDEDAPIRIDFEDGTSALTDAVIGADGIHSFVRPYLLGADHPAAKEIFAGAVAWRQIVPMDLAIEKLGREHAENSTNLLGPGGFILTYPLDKGASVNIVAGDLTRKSWNHEDRRIPAKEADLRKFFKDWGPQAHAAIDLIASKPIYLWGLYHHLPAPYYYNNRVVMLGDAAHASLPFQGQGAGHGIEDAATLDALLARTRTSDQLPLAFEAYDQIRRPRSQRMVKTSFETGLLLSFQEKGVGADLAKIKKKLETKFHWLWWRDIDAQNRAAVEIFEESLPKMPPQTNGH